MKCLNLLSSKDNKVASSLYIKKLYCFAFAVIAFSFLSIPTGASTIGEEFTTDIDDNSKGLIVSIDKNNPSSIELGSTQNNSYLLGVIADESSNGIVYSKADSNVVVTVRGVVEVFVSDANGEIKTGDFVSTSWLEGVGMKIQDDKNLKILGVALEDFNYSNSTAYGEIKTPDGLKSVNISTISIRLLEKEAISNPSSASKSGLEKYIESIAGGEVSLVRIISGLTIFLACLLVASLFVYSSIRGSFVSIGRNPMASNFIYRNLIQVTTGSVTIILVGALLTYIILVI